MNEFGVFMRPADGGEPVFDRVEAVSIQRAVLNAEANNPGHRAYAVTQRAEVIGRCRNCRIPLFAHDRASRDVSGLACEDCFR